jgi:hypothetical protein
MKLARSVHSHLTYILNEKSKYDGRLLVIVALLGYFGLLFLSSIFTDYTNFWHKLGVPAFPRQFVDLGNVISGFECTRLGYDVLLRNPCDPINSVTPVMYPRIWMTLTPLGIDQSHTITLGIMLVLLLYASIFILTGKLNYYEALFYSLILCSPSIMLLVERGNVDIIVFLLLFLSWVILCKSNQLIGRYLGYSLISFAAFLKLFPIFGLSVLLKERGKVFIVSAAIFVTPFLIYCLSHSQELRDINGIVPDTNYFSYGYKVIFMNIKGWLSYPYLLTDNKAILFFVIQSMFFMTSFLIGCKFILNALQEFKTWRSRAFQTGSSTVYNEEGSYYIDSFRLGCGLYIGTFMLGNVHDYKSVFLLFTIPQILDWIRRKIELSLPSSFALLGIIATLYLCVFYRLIFDEVINWFLLGYFLWSFLFSLPTWAKSLVHNILSRRLV